MKETQHNGQHSRMDEELRCPTITWVCPTLETLMAFMKIFFTPMTNMIFMNTEPSVVGRWVLRPTNPLTFKALNLQGL
ncbi:unnamed protein product [Triticum turgidum subsp. durum]|uniref:Uncharacterized protein n=1 Tax=Triticum turgidum subsp. durum TaxID=4567 RepID=A0A9R0ZWV4_TRITD|nr:unnamed protein product [Triticum turgidum subsp. durum]